MKRFFYAVSVILTAAGFFIPVAWIGAAIAILLAISAAPDGVRPDGKPRTGGLFGGVIDSMVVKSKMTDCPYCMTKIMKTARKCPNCQEWVTPDIKI